MKVAELRWFGILDRLQILHSSYRGSEVWLVVSQEERITSKPRPEADHNRDYNRIPAGTA